MSADYTEVLELAVAIEMECAAIYEVYARLFAAHAELAYFWRLYAEAERYHAATIRIHQAALASMTPQGDQRFEVEAADARRFLEELRALRARIEREGTSIGESLTTARRIEESSAELHGRTQFFTIFPEFGDLLTKMADEDRAHRDVLASAEARWG